MTKLELIKLPNPNLRRVSAEIKAINRQVKILSKDMIRIALDWEKNRACENTVGLAAVQVNHLHRIIIVRQLDSRNSTNFQILINPRITSFDGEQTESFEGCLSVDKFYSKVKRYHSVRVEALDLNGQLIKLTADGFLARVFQHEIDHLNGILTVDRVDDLDSGFCCLGDQGELQVVDYDRVLKAGILKNE